MVFCVSVFFCSSAALQLTVRCGCHCWQCLGLFPQFSWAVPQLSSWESVLVAISVSVLFCSPAALQLTVRCGCSCWQCLGLSLQFSWAAPQLCSWESISIAINVHVLFCSSAALQLTVVAVAVAGNDWFVFSIQLGRSAALQVGVRISCN